MTHSFLAQLQLVSVATFADCGSRGLGNAGHGAILYPIGPRERTAVGEFLDGKKAHREWNGHGMNDGRSEQWHSSRE